jgi:hypothetical protein
MFAFVKAAQTPVRNPLLSTYWTMAAVRHGDFVAKVRVAPDAESAEHAIHRNLDNPWRVTAEHRPLGEIMDVRLGQPHVNRSADARCRARMK